jgi:putative phage-type endonuclease
MITDEQRANRLNGLGASDSAIHMGYSTYKTPYELYLEKTGLISIDDDEMTEQQYWGNALESAILDRFEYENDDTYVTYPETVYHKDYPFIFANLDAYDKAHNMVIEAKNSNSFMRAEWDDGIPMQYMIQIAKQVAIMDAEGGYCAVLIGGCEYRQFIYERDRELEEMIIKADLNFWSCVQHRIEPELLTISDAMRKYVDAKKGKRIEAHPMLNDHLNILANTKLSLSQMTKQQDKAKLAVMTYMGDAESLVNESGKTICTWKQGKKSRTFLIK